ncbi:hypothetical protein [Algoriphagus sp. Y33]|uniref:hypothetical protein n=1 Tax=Algoriphagus sp. Y33 TaxID=2772483 RepID=UPI00177DAA4E|nr:hypothetical protein [Algoriphagus sp. Y33]
MKSSPFEANRYDPVPTTHSGMIINPASRLYYEEQGFYPVSFVTGQFLTIENSYNHAKSSISKATHRGMIIPYARFHVANREEL